MFTSSRNTRSFVPLVTVLQQRPFPPSCFHRTSQVLRSHPPPCQLPFPSLPHRRALLLCLPLALGFTRSARASRVPFLSFWPCRRSYPGGVPHLFALSSVRDADFVHTIGTRPPLSLIFTRLPLRSLLLRPGLSRSTLSGYIVESLSAPPFPIAHRLLATWLQSFTTFGTWR